MFKKEGIVRYFSIFVILLVPLLSFENLSNFSFGSSDLINQSLGNTSENLSCVPGFNTNLCESLLNVTEVSNVPGTGLSLPEEGDFQDETELIDNEASNPPIEDQLTGDLTLPFENVTDFQDSEDLVINESDIVIPPNITLPEENVTDFLDDDLVINESDIAIPDNSSLPGDFTLPDELNSTDFQNETLLINTSMANNTNNTNNTNGNLSIEDLGLFSTGGAIINFTSPTPPDATITENTSFIINVSIIETNLVNLTYNWNGTNYSMYDPSLVLMMNFDNVSSLGENSTQVVDLSLVGNNGTLKGNAFINASAKYGKALQLDGSGDYIDAGNSTTFDFTNRFTLSAWVKSTVDGYVIVKDPITQNFRDTSHLTDLVLNSKINPTSKLVILQAFVDPDKVHPGEIMKIYAHVEDPTGVEKVTAEMFHDQGSDIVILNLINGSVYDGWWNNQWLVHDTGPHFYNSTIVAKNIFGDFTFTSVKWSDWSDTAGGDHGGADWTPSNGANISGVHTNIGTFKILTGTTVYVDGYQKTAYGGSVQIQAATINVSGTLDASGRGYGGGGGGSNANIACTGGTGGTGGGGGRGGLSQWNSNCNSNFGCGSGGGGSPNGTSQDGSNPGVSGNFTGGGAGGSSGGAGGTGYGGGGGGGGGCTAAGGGGGAGGSGGSTATSQTGGAGGGTYGGSGGAGVSNCTQNDGINGGYRASASNGDTTSDTSVFMGGGGGGGASSTSGSCGGGGGGAGAGGGSIIFNTTSRIVVTGSILSQGGGGGTSGRSNMGEGGGGAGGGILFYGPTVTFTGTVDLRGRNLNTLSTTNGGTWKIFYSTYTGGGTNYTGRSSMNLTLFAPPKDVPFSLSTFNGGELLIINNSVSSLVSAGGNINDGSWHHLLGTYNGSLMSVYVDGILKNTANSFSGNIPENNDPLLIGAHYNPNISSNYFNGGIDEVRVWNRSLSATEVYEQYISNLNRYNSTQWYFYVNQSKNTTATLGLGNYTYQVSTLDASAHTNSSELRTIRIADITPPNVSFSGSTPDNDTQLDTGTFTITISVIEINPTNVTYYLYNSSQILINSTTFGMAAVTSNTTISYTSLTNGIYYYNVTVYDTSGNPGNSETRTININPTGPIFNFEDPTPQNNSNVSISFVVNVSIVESNLANIIYIWNGTNYSMYDNNLVLMMNFDNVSVIGDNSTYAVDLSKYSNNGTLRNGTRVNTTNCKYGNCFTFDGVNDYIDVGNSSVFNFTNKLTLAAWVKSSSNGYVIVKDPTSSTVSYLINLTQAGCTSNWGWGACGSTSGWGTSTSYSDGSQTAYIKCSWTDTLPAGTTITNIRVDPIYTSHYENDGVADWYLNGLQMLNNDNLGNSGTSCGSYEDYPLPFNITGSTNISYYNISGVNSLYIYKQTGSWYILEGTNGKVNITITSSSGKNVPYALSTINGGQFFISNSNGSYNTSAGGNINDGSWHHLLATYNGSVMSVYVDGILKNSSSNFSGNLPSNNLSVWIGRNYDPDSTTGYFNGSMDEVRIWNRSLSAAEVYEQYVSNLNKFSPTNWYLYVNQSKNATANLDYGTYTFQMQGEDTGGFENSSVTRTIQVIEFNSPIISFLPPTPANGSLYPLNYLPLKILVSEENPAYVTYNLYNSSQTLINSTTLGMATSTSNDSFTFSALSDGTYYYNVTIIDLYSNQNTTALRTVSISTVTTPPIVNFITPTPGNASPSFNYVIINASISEAFLDQLIFNWNEVNYSLYNNSLVLMYNFDNLSSLGENSTNIADLSGNEHSSALFGNTAITSSGKYGSAASFDGAADYYSINNSDYLNLANQLAIEFWINPTAGNINDGIIHKGGLSNSQSIYSVGFYTGVDAKLVFRINGSTSENNGQITAPSALSSSTWYHVVAQYNGSTMELYQNGQLVNSDTQTLTFDANTDNLIIGCAYNTSTCFAGKLDNLRIYNQSLSATEIYERYVSNLQKFNSTQWYLYVNQSKNVTTILENTTYDYQVFAIDTSGTSNNTELRRLDNKREVIDFLETYENNYLRSFFGINSSIRIKTIGYYRSAPFINITDSNGTVKINNGSMYWEGDAYFYNYSLNGSNGWYSVAINGLPWSYAFYQGAVWPSDYLDNNGNAFTFRKPFNITEPGRRSRLFEPVDIPVSFTYGPDNVSVRVVYDQNGTLVEIPSQLYNFNYSGSDLSSARLVFLTSINQSENQTFYLSSSKARITPNYTTDLSLTGSYILQNSNLVTNFSQPMGGLLANMRDLDGGNSSLAGTEPMEYYPEFQIGLTTYSARSDTTSSVQNYSGKLLSWVNISGNANDVDSKPYTLFCKLYALSNYVICEKNISTTATESWKNFYFTGLVFSDGSFNKITYLNATNEVVDLNLSSGDGSDRLGINYSIPWMIYWRNATNDIWSNVPTDAVAEIFLNNSYSVTSSSALELYDDAEYDYYVLKLIGSSSASVPSGSSFYLKSARLIYNSRLTSKYENHVNNTRDNLLNPLSASWGVEVTSDNTNPSYGTVSASATNDTANVTFSSYWTDDSYLDYAVINISGPGENGSRTSLYYNSSYSLRINGAFTNESWQNTTISNINAGEIFANITVYDVAGRSNSTLLSVNVTDVTVPQLSITYSPSTAAELDPNVTINISANITDYSDISSAILYYWYWNGTNNTDPVVINLSNVSEVFYTSAYFGNFTAEQEANYSFYIFVNDTQGNSINSSTYNISVAYDWTWNLSPTSFPAASGSLGTRIQVSNLTISDTGDRRLSFRVTSNWENKNDVYFGGGGTEGDVAEGTSGYTFSFLLPGDIILPVSVTAKSIERSDTLILTVTALNSSASPSSSTSNGTLVSYAAGPFLLVTITQYNSTVTQGNTGITLNATVQNKGNETATGTLLTWQLPTGWTITSGEENKSIGNLTVNSIADNFVTVSISDSAPTGTQNITSLATSNENKTGSDTEYIAVAAQSTETIIETPPSSSSSSSGGGSAAGAGGGGGSSIFNPGEEDVFFQSAQDFELTRGEDQTFVIVLENPFNESIIKNISVSLDGFAADYLTFSPKLIPYLGPGETINLTATIVAPAYFTKSKYELAFQFEGQLIKVSETGARRTLPLKYTKDVTLEILDISRQSANEYKDDSYLQLNEIQMKGFNAREIKDLLQELELKYTEKDFKTVKELAEKISALTAAATELEQGILEINDAIILADRKKVDTKETQKQLSLAKSAFDRGDFLTAAERLKEAKLTLAIETQGHFVGEAIYMIKENKLKAISIGLGALIVVIFMLIMARWLNLKRRKVRLAKEDNILFGLMKTVQIDVFQKNKLSMRDYGEAMTQYEHRLNLVLQESLTVENRLFNFFRFKTKKHILQNEKERILAKIREVQQSYLKNTKYETRAYENMLQSYSARLSDVEEQLALLDVKEAKKLRGVK